MESAHESRAWARRRVRGLVIEALAEGLTGGLHVLASPFTAGRRRRAMKRLLSTRSDAVTLPLPSPDAKPPRVFLVAGEPSGDERASEIVQAMREIAPGTRFEGFGGACMAEAGVDLHVRMDDLPVMGFVGVAGRVRIFADLLVDVVSRLHRNPPDVLVLVDYPGFNLRAARAARPLGIPTVQVVVPQIWAWAPWRLPVVARSVDLLVAVLAFEPRLFEGTPARAVFAGHPLVERLSGTEPWSAEGDWIGLFPGSREQEVETLLPLMLDAAARLVRDLPEARFVLPVAGAAVAATVERLTATSPVPVRIVTGRTREVAASLRSAMVASGTATLELGLFGVPMAVVYPIGRFQRLLRRALLISPFFALVNVVAGREVVSERLVRGNSGEAKALAGRIAKLHVDGPEREGCLTDLAGVRDRLAGEGAVERAARAVLHAAGGRARDASSRPAPDRAG